MNVWREEDWKTPLDKLEKIEYLSLQAVLADGWQVD